MNKEKSLKKVHILIIILGSLFVLLSIFHNNLWFDEAYSVGMANHNIKDICKIGSCDVHPIIYYFALQIINILTNGSIIAYRIFSTIPIILLGILGITHIKKDFGEKTGIIFSFLSFFLPIISIYANEIRMYSWTAYILTIFTIYTYRIYKQENYLKNWILWGIFSFISIHIHYYGLIFVAVINLVFLIFLKNNKRWKDLKKQIVIIILLFLSYVPWIFIMFSQIKHVSKGFWIGFEFPKTIIELLGFQMAGILNIWVGFIINILLFIYLFIIYFKRKNNEDMNILKNILKIYLIIIVFLLIISISLKTSIIYYRYLFVFIGGYIFAISYLLSKENLRNIIAVCTIIFVISLTNNIKQIRINYDKENGKQIEYLKENIKMEDIIVYKDNEIGSIFAINFPNNKQYFYNPENWGITESYKVWGPQMEIYINKDFLKKCIGRVWIIDTDKYELYNELFNNFEFKYINSKRFETKYQDYNYNIILVERIK